RRAELAGEFGVGAVLAVPFDEEMATWAPAAFVDNVLVDGLDSRAGVLGRKFTVGRRASATAQTMVDLCEARGMTCAVVEHLEDGGERVSSSRIRRLLSGAAVAAAAEILGRPHRVSGLVVHGAGRGGWDLGYPTANLDLAEHTAVPADGVYAGWFTVLDDALIDG